MFVIVGMFYILILSLIRAILTRLGRLYHMLLLSLHENEPCCSDHMQL